MTAEANKALVREFFAIIDRGDVTALDGVLAPDFRLHLAGMPGPLDRAAATGMLAGLLAGMPGVRHQLHDLVAEDERERCGWWRSAPTAATSWACPPAAGC